MKPVQLFIATALLISLFALPLSATMLLPMNDQQLVESAETVVVGTIVDYWYQLHERKDVPMTYAKVEVEMVLKGDMEKEMVTVRALGGKVADMHSEVYSSPKLDELGKRLFLFVHDDLNTFHCNIMGWEQGSLEIDDTEYIEAKDMTLEEYVEKISKIVEAERIINRHPFTEQ